MTDLFISELTYAPGSGFGAFFTAVGECPALFPALCALGAFVYLAASKQLKDKSARKKAFAFFLYTAATVVVTAAVVILLKNLWGRARYTELSDHGAGFTPWYLPQGLTGHDSFPSGHAAMSALVFFVSDGIAALFRALCLRLCGIRKTEPSSKKVLPINYPSPSGSAVDSGPLR